MIFELSGSRLRVMGTIHLLPAGRPLPPWVRPAYDWSEAVFVEHSPSEFLALARQPGEAADHELPPALAQRLKTAAPAVDPAMFDGLQRGAAVLLALASRVAEQADAGVDQALHGWSQADGKLFGYLESPRAVLAMLNAIDPADWIAGIQAEQALPGRPAEQLQVFYDAWRKGRLEQIDTLGRQGLFSSAAIRAAMLTERNAAWARHYADPERRSLVAVGAAHLVGRGNFLETLAAASGRSVRRIA